MYIETFKRRERKYLITDDQRASLSKLLESEMKPDKYCVGGKTYSLYNIYFDTSISDVAIEASLKPYYREKLRLRSYYPSPENDALVFLELKKKTGGITHKRRARLTFGEAKAYVRNRICPENASYMQKQVLDETSAFFERFPGAAPAMYITYDRCAMFGKTDANLRITFDTNIRAEKLAPDRYFPLANDSGDGISLLPEGMCLMEIKIPNALPLWLARALSELGIYSTNFSKYGLAALSFENHYVPPLIFTGRSERANVFVNTPNVIPFVKDRISS